MNQSKLSFKTALALTLTLAILSACERGTDSPAVYQSVWTQSYPNASNPHLQADTLQGDFQSAASTDSVAEAELRWNRFLTNWSPNNKEFDDAMHAHLVSWAELELERLQHQKKNNLDGARAAQNKLRTLAKQIE